MAEPPVPGTPRARLMTLDAERRARLLDPAEAEFAARGFAGASLNRILAQAGMSKGQAYHYIADKADLYEAVIARAFARLTDALGFTFGRPADAEAFWERVEALFTRLGEVLGADKRLAALATGVHENETTRAALPQGFPRERFEWLVTLGQSLGAVRTDMPNSLLMSMLFAMAVETDRWFARNWATLDPNEARRLNRVTISMFRAMAAPGEPDEGG